MITPSDLYKSRILVVGGASGIGFAIAQAVASMGARVTITSRNAGQLRLATDLLKYAEAASVDVTDVAEVEALFAKAGSFDHIIFAPGEVNAARGSAFLDMDVASAQSYFNLQFWGAVSIARHGAMHLTQGGSITLTSVAVSSHHPTGQAIAFSMAKAMEQLMVGLAEELAPARLNIVRPEIRYAEHWERFPAARWLPAGTQDRSLENLPVEIINAYLELMHSKTATGRVLGVGAQDGGPKLRA